MKHDNIASTCIHYPKLYVLDYIARQGYQSLGVRLANKTSLKIVFQPQGLFCKNLNAFSLN